MSDRNEKYEAFVKECKELFGMNTNYKFVYVDEIPKLRSGKFRMTVCKIGDNNSNE